jgi:glycosyltransferase involved in cell wall biosynthesis
VKANLLIVSPVRNESAHIERVVRAVAAQTRPPDVWVVVDDSSTDGTWETLSALAPEVPFMRVMRAPTRPSEAGAHDRLAVAADAKTFNAGLNSVAWKDFTHVGKLDGDVELPPEYFEEVLAAFAEDSRIGMACGELIEYQNGRARRLSKTAHHVHGALKTYTIDCFCKVGGIREQLGWDAIDETYARMLGYRTGSVGQLEAIHHRPAASADGTLRGRARHGECAFIAYQGVPWVLARSLKLSLRAPVGLSGLAFLYGYFRAAARGVPRVDDPLYRRYARWELRQRMLWPVVRRAQNAGS